MSSIFRDFSSRVVLRTVTAVLWLSTLGLVFAVQNAAAQDAGSIQGKVTDQSGAPIFGAVIVVERGGDSRVTVTDMDGAFQISLLTPGTYHVKISAAGMSDWAAESLAGPADAKPVLAI